MNTNPNAITVLCYGDSNTHGTKPDRSGRYTANERWTGLLQSQLGDKYYVIEEGLGGRTTDLEHYDPTKPTRNGLTHFKASIDSHLPLDFVIIMLGTNDLKTIYERSTNDIAEALRQYPAYIHEITSKWNLPLPHVLLVSPAYMDENAPKFIESMPTAGIYDADSAQKSHELADQIKRLASETDCWFLDAGPLAKVGDDGCHLTLDAHKNLADSISKIIVNSESTH